MTEKNEEMKIYRRSFWKFILLVDRLRKFGHMVEIDADTQDVKVYDCDGRMTAWISGAVQDRYVVYDAEGVTPAERKAIDAYTGLPTGERK